ncbi:nucleoside triphosphate pyrophosphohydrolase [Clostridium sp. SYSU_GA19001]|uniref:nucleoside triphosphate pyrophosphohydrolase n=1 Tax=Clostridium caldaquaticum TaxID=2940653 RepID=UPI0020776290|nr:nucleoside triphosphate pyrophosphohydrolase [Clostridium caldaquaticum]MCM8709567.1 nucleoside triphosphate pyrophosphohydrolase [Clostridium caldaquaticum]
MIKIVGLGPGAKEAMTLGTLEVLKKGSKVFLRTCKHPNVEYLKELGVEFKTYDDKYDTFDSFDEVYNSIAKELIDEYEKSGDIVYAVPGHPLVAEKSVTILLELCREKGIQTEIYPAVSFVDAIMESLKLDPVEGLKIIDAFDIKNQVLDKRIGTIITQVYNKYIASEVKLALNEYYRDDTEVYFIRAAGVKEFESIRKIALYELDRQEDIDHLTSIYIPKDLNNTMDFHDLLAIMDTLRGEDGCPWDKEQTHESLKRYLIEECYEVLEAIDEKNEDMLIEELGDVLLQVVFHARIGKEEGYFDMSDVIKGISNKMIERHPHIFGKVKAETSEEVLKNWDEIKKKEKGFESYTEELRHVPKNLPALMRAEKVQAKARKVGFDWDKVEDALNKVFEEFNEVKDVYKGKNRAKILEEVGDLIFAVVNVCRFLDIEPENALNYTIEKFINRFEYIEKVALSKGMKLKEMTLEQMDALWEEAKQKKILAEKKEF